MIVEKFNGEEIKVYPSLSNHFMLVEFQPDEEKGWAIGHTTSPLVQATTLEWKISRVTALKDKKSAEVDYKNLERTFHKRGGFISFYDETEAQNFPRELTQVKHEKIFTTGRAG